MDSDTSVNPALPPSCKRCGYIPEILDKIPVQCVPIALVRSCYVPHPNCVNDVLASITSCNDSINSIEDEIHKHRVAIAQLQSRLENIRTFKEFQRSLLAPIPDEILQEIFTYICSNPINIGDSMDSIWVLQRVCARWRRIVRCTPSLWKSFVVKKRSASVAAVKLRIQLCLKFSVMRPLSISIQGDQHQFRTEYPWGICAEIGRHTDRWRLLVFNAGVLNYALGGSTLLQSNKDLDNFDDIFVDATVLEEVELRNILSLPPANWSGVRKLIMDECELSLADDDSFSAFRNMSSLEELAWRKSYINRGPIPLSPQNLGEITLPLLHTLHIQPSRYFNNFLDWVPPVYIWSMLYVPSLTHIQITDNIPGLEFHSIMLMIQESGSIIKKLHLDRFSFSFFLTSVQELCDVEEFFLTKPIDNNMHTEDILALLIWGVDPDSDNFLPSLRKLELCDTALEGHENFFLVLMDVMHSRSSNLSAEIAEQQPSPSFPLPLLSVKCTVMISEPGHESSVAEVERLGDELGIKVEIVVELPLHQHRGSLSSP